MTARTWSLGVVVAVVLIVNTACGSSVGSTTPDVFATEGSPVSEIQLRRDAEPDGEPVSDGQRDLVDADEVRILGELTVEQRDMVEWGLHRFSLSGLYLPPEIEFAFDPSTELCGGNAGRCRPRSGDALVIVCEQAGDTMGRIIDRRIVLLHELAHVWDWGQGDGTAWLNRTEIVGGEVGSPLLQWADRCEERVAMAVAWGLMDQLRRPVGSDFACAELNAQFQRLTGREPLGPIRPVCVL